MGHKAKKVKLTARLGKKTARSVAKLSMAERTTLGIGKLAGGLRRRARGQIHDHPTFTGNE